MLSAVWSDVPSWLTLGILLGLAASVAAALAFYVGARLYPTKRRGSGARTGESRRKAEIRSYLDAIGEQYAEGHPVEGQEVAFYLPERDVAITFDARAFYRIERSPTHAVLVEHELPGVHLGSRLPFDTPDVDVGADEETDPAAAAFAVLGVPETATRDEVKAAYRELVKEVHPDHGGSHDEFRRVREAYVTAKQHAATERPTAA